jgi:hypothetical protein
MSANNANPAVRLIEGNCIYFNSDCQISNDFPPDF